MRAVHDREKKSTDIGKRTEENLQEVSKYTRSLIEASLDPLVTISPEGKITDVNKATELVTGVSREKLIGTDFSNYFTEPEKAREGYQEVFEKGFVKDYPLAIRHVSGSITDVLYNASVYRNEAGEIRGVFAAARDITERKRVEEANSWLASIVEFSDDAVIGKTLDGIIMSWNPSAKKIYGHSAVEVIGKPVSILIPPGHYNEVPKILERIKLGETINHYESVRLRKDGKQIDVSLTISPIKDAAGKIIGASTIARDITDRKLMEEQLRASSLYTRSLIEISLDPLVTISPEGKITDVNKATELVTGVSREHLIGRDFSDYFTEPEKAKGGYEQVFEKGFVKDYPLAIRHVSGSITDVLYNASVYKDAAGNNAGVFAAARDVTERKRMEDIARVQRQRFYDLLETLPVYIILLTPDYHVSFSNRFFRERFGESNGRRCFEFLFERNEPCEICETYTVLKTLTPHEWEWTGPDSRNYYVFDYPFTDNDGSILILEMGIDITERKRAEETLRESEHVKSELIYKFNEAQVVGKIGIWEWNLQTNQVWWSDGTYRIFGVTPQDYVPSFESNGKFIHPDDYAKYKKSFEHSIQTTEPLNLDTRLIAADGQLKYCNAQAKILSNDSGQPIRFIGTLLDITERKRMEEELKVSEERFRLITETIKDVFWMSTPGVGKMIYISPAYERLWERSCESLYRFPQSFLDPVHPEDKPKMLDVVGFHKQGKPYEIEYRIVQHSGSVRWMRERGYPVHDAMGQLRVMTGIVSDITESKQKEEELKKHRDHLDELVKERTKELVESEEMLRLAKEEAEHANMAKTNFLQTMSHELRTPLNAVLGFSEMLKQKTTGELNEKQEHYIENIITGGNNLNNIISQILEIVKMDKGTLELSIEKIPVLETLDEQIEVIKEKAAKKNVLLEINLDPELEYIEADKQKFKQVFINLLDNAVKFSKPEGGTVTISAKKEGDIARFSISDTGIGIKEEDVGKLFKKFTQLDIGTDRKYGGTGIGLAISKQFVELHGGRIWVESKYGEGTTFTFTIPIEAKRGKQENT